MFLNQLASHILHCPLAPKLQTAVSDSVYIVYINGAKL